MRSSVSRFTFVLSLCAIVFATGCRGDEVAVTLEDIEITQQKIQALLDQRAQEAAPGFEKGWAEGELVSTTRSHAVRLSRLRQAYEDNTWDMLGPPGATARSIVITYLRELEDERTRLENLAAEPQP